MGVVRPAISVATLCYQQAKFIPYSFRESEIKKAHSIKWLFLPLSDRSPQQNYPTTANSSSKRTPGFGSTTWVGKLCCTKVVRNSSALP